MADETERGELMELADGIPEDSARGSWKEEEIQGFCEAVAALRFPDQLEGFWRLAVLEEFAGTWNTALAHSFALLPEKASMELLQDLTERYADVLVVDCLDLLAKILLANPGRILLLQSVLQDLCRNIPEGRQWTVYRGDGYEAFRKRIERQEEGDEIGSPRNEPKPMSLSPETLLHFLILLEHEGMTGEAVQLLEALLLNPVVFVPERLLFDAWRAAGESAVSGRVPGLLWQASARFLLARSEFPPAHPKDWSDLTPVKGRGPQVEVLRDFLKDTQAECYAYRANQGDRSAMESLIRHQHLDIDCRTEERGRPYTLHLTKNRAAFRHAVETHRADLAKMRDLLLLENPSDDPAFAPLAARMRHTTA